MVKTAKILTLQEKRSGKKAFKLMKLLSFGYQTWLLQSVLFYSEKGAACIFKNNFICIGGDTDETVFDYGYVENNNKILYYHKKK